jgi:ribonuclease P/MRP protein subunit POP5
MVWAALSFMDAVPVKNGKSCVFRVVRVSGTIRKSEEEAVRRARALILKARRAMEEEGKSTLDGILGKEADSVENNLMVDRDDSDEEDEEMSDGD